jgi:hypothetical protein
MIAVNEEYYENLDKDKINKIIEGLSLNFPSFGISGGA